MTPRDRKPPRLFVDGLRERGVLLCGSSLSLPSSETHYLRDVLRLPVGTTLELGDPEHPGLFRVTITSLDASEAIVTIDASIEDQGAEIPVTLLCALCKGQKNDLICDWATELGCERIIFWQAERSIVRVRSNDECANKEQRLSKIATAAAQQSRQVRPPKVRVVQSLQTALNEISREMTPQTLNLRCSLEHDALPIADIVTGVRTGTQITIAIGPEGDITPEEHSLLARSGFKAVSLGPKVLRSELAVVTALASIRALSS